MVLASAGSARAQARIDGISGQTSFSFTAKAGEVSTPDGGSVHFWGYEDLGNNEGVGLPQYPGPTLILNQNDSVTITLTSELPHPELPNGQCTSIVFPGSRGDGHRRQHRAPDPGVLRLCGRHGDLQLHGL